MMTDNEMTFEAAMKQLEEIVKKLEAGDVPLEKAISYYQKGMDLAKICHQKLTSVQKQMTTILNEHGELDPFNIQEESDHGSET